MRKHWMRKTCLLTCCAVLIAVTALFFGCAAQPATLASSPAASSTAVSPSATTAASPAASMVPVKTVAAVKTTFPAAAKKPAKAGLPKTGAYSIVLDVNPSIELKIENGAVTKVTAYNDDGQKLLLKTDVTGMKSEDAIKKLVEAMAAEGYINNTETKPCLLISLLDAAQPVPGLADSLKEIANSSLKALDLKCNIKTASIPQDVVAKADALGISAARYVIFDAIAKHESITIEQAIAKYGALKVAELLRLYDDLDKVLDDKSDSETDKEQDKALSLTPEQQTVLDAATTKYQAAIKSAEEAYVKGKAEAIDNLKAQWEKIKTDRKGQENTPEFKQARKALMAEYKKLRMQIYDTFKAAVLSAQSEFKTAVASLGLTGEQMDKLLDYRVKGKLADDCEKYIGTEGQQTVSSDKKTDEAGKPANHGKGGKDKDKNKDEEHAKSGNEAANKDQGDNHQENAVNNGQNGNHQSANADNGQKDDRNGQSQNGNHGDGQSD